MTTTDIIENLLEEYTRRTKNGERSYQIKDSYSSFYINKYYSEEEQVAFGKKGLLTVLDHIKTKRDLIIAENDTASLQTLYKSINPHQFLFEFCVPYAAPELQEEDIFPFLAYYDSSPRLEIYNDLSKKTFEADISNALLYHGYVLDLVIIFQQQHSLSEQLVTKLEQLKDYPSIKEYESQLKRIDDVINGESRLYRVAIPEKIIKKLSASDLASGKKWEWLQKTELKFIERKEDFFSLIEALSEVNYFNKQALRPSSKEIIELIDPEEFEVFVLDLYHEIQKDGKKRSGWFVGDKVIAFQIFVWLMHHLDTPNQFSVLSKLAEKCFSKIPGVGPVSRKLGDVILKILEESETIEGLGILLNLKVKSKYPVFRDALTISIKNAINYTKLDPNEVEDYFIDDYGLADGEVDSEFGAFRSTIIIEDFSKVNLQWYKEDGSIQKSVPAKVKTDYASELKLWKAKQKDIKKGLSAQKQRVEGFWRKKKKWAYPTWERYLLNHQLLRYVSRPLIWQFEDGGIITSAMWHEGNLIDANGTAIEGVHSTSVSLWHPSSATVEEVQSWRQLILDKEIKQPFKQAFREIYLVTDAEITTSTYSNRFLNHVVRHHKFAALAKQRIWTYANVYAQHPPYIKYPDYGIAATFDLENNHDFANTGRVHFRDTRRKQALSMEDVPVLIFSETMRDIDLFVGVCSIGIEDEWNQNQYRQYWRNYSTSDLSETAKTRRVILANMLPKLAIKDQCELTDKYLKVKGTVRTYKIHLGSGNILMEPNDQYLCIVPARGKKGPADSLFLPFDDDAVFSIILSKAFLLANDDTIKDEVILNQIKP